MREEEAASSICILQIGKKFSTIFSKFWWSGTEAMLLLQLLTVTNSVYFNILVLVLRKYLHYYSVRIETCHLHSIRSIH